MLYMHLLRIKCESLPQSDLLRTLSDPVAVITQAFREKPTSEVGRRSEWHIGNVEPIDSDAIGFAVGRTAAVTSPKFDAKSHDFLEEEVLRAPFTLGVFDQRHQVAGIVKKSGVSQSSREIADKLASLLNSSRAIVEANARVAVDPIIDPVSFIQSLRGAAQVTKFSFVTSRPNPHDVQRLIQRPAEEFTEAVGGTKTKVQTEGEDLDRDLLTDLTQAIASVGEEAAATVRPEPGAKTKRIYLGGSPVVEPVDGDTTKGLMKSMVEKAREAYDRVRHSLNL